MKKSICWFFFNICQEQPCKQSIFFLNFKVDTFSFYTHFKMLKSIYRSCVLLHPPPPRIGLDGLQTGQFFIVPPLIRCPTFIKREIWRKCVFVNLPWYTHYSFALIYIFSNFALIYVLLRKSTVESWNFLLARYEST